MTSGLSPFTAELMTTTGAFDGTPLMSQYT